MAAPTCESPHQEVFSSPSRLSPHNIAPSANFTPDFGSPQPQTKKRRYSGHHSKQYSSGGGSGSKRRRREQLLSPPLFHKGGTVRDPLALDSRQDADSAESSPHTTLSPEQNDPVVAANPRDPLNLLKKVKRKRQKRRRHSNQPSIRPAETALQVVEDASTQGSGHKKDKQFTHGNYRQYYGKRLPGKDSDRRFNVFKREWFLNKDCLDIGCNIGHVTLTIAAQFQPNCITGVDIDGHLIGVARKNIVHYTSSQKMKNDGIPPSFSQQYGTLHMPLPSPSSNYTAFPNNVKFTQCNYVLETDAELSLVRPEYDVILALSITKWIHLNGGDAGLKRFFMRIFRHLRPGGMFLLEPQQWCTYAKKRGLTPDISQTYLTLELKPDQFSSYLTNELGFSLHHMHPLGNQQNEGFNRPIYCFVKPS